MESSTENYQYQYQHQQQQLQEAAAYTEQPQLQQSYDQSATTTATQTAAYYDYYYASYNNTQQQQQQQQQSYCYYYYPQYDQQQPTFNMTTHLDNQQNVYFPAEGHQLHFNPGSDSGSNPVGISHVALQSQITQSTHRGRGRRGKRPFRGLGRGHSVYRGPGPDGSIPSSSAMGRGQSGGGHLPPHGAASTQNSAFPLGEGVVHSMPPSAPVAGHASMHVLAQVPSTPLWPPPRMAWCELCRVDCNTLEILEQHKNGKRHKKNLQVHEELQNLNKIITGQQNVHMPNSEFKQEVLEPEKVVGSKEKEQPQDLPSQAVTNVDRNETEQLTDNMEKSEKSAADMAEVSGRKARNHFEARGRGLKRKMRGGRGGKYARTNDGPRIPAEPPKPKEVIPFICELCNVKCESQVVFDSHLAGKKHLSKLKRFHGHHALYGEAALQALYPPNFNATPSAVTPQTQQGIDETQVVLTQPLTCVLTQAQVPGIVDAAATIIPLAAAPGSSMDATQHHNCPTQGSETVSESESKINFTLETKTQQQSVMLEFEAPLGNVDDKQENGTSANAASADSLALDNMDGATVPQDETKDVGCRPDSLIMASSGALFEAEQVLCGAASDKDVIVPESEAASLDQAVQPGPSNN